MKKPKKLKTVKKAHKMGLLFLVIIFISLTAAEISYSLDDVSKDTDYFLNVTEDGHEYLPGQETKVYSYNGEIPGPVIRAEKGDEITVEVKNNLDESTTVHWHGIQLPNKMDGVPDLTQSPIEPGETKKYEFKLENPGTYWYHSHFNTDKQIDKGLQAPLIIDYEDEPYEYQQDKIVMVDDIALNEEGEHFPFEGNKMHGRYGNTPVVNGEVDSEILVEQGKIKLRLINTANARTFNIGIGNQDFKVVAADIGLKPSSYETDEVRLAPGQRYEIIVDAEKQEEIEIYEQGAREKYTLATLKTQKTSENQRTWRKQLQDIVNRIKDALTQQKQKEVQGWELNESLYDEKPDRVATLQPVMRNETFGWAINGKTYPEDPEVFNLNEDEFYKFRIRNEHGEPHPMHIHGQKFKVMTRDEEKIEEPAWRDTVLVNGRETVEIGFKAEGKGQWAFHCHTLEHSKAGMLGTINIT